MLRLSSRKPSLGIEITATTVRLAALSGKRPDVSIDYMRTADLPAGTVCENYASTTIGDLGSLVEALRACLPEAARSYRRAALSLPDGLFRVQTMEFDELPPSPEDRERLIRWRLEKAAAFDLNETVLRYQVLQRETKGYTVLVCVAKQAVIAQYEQALLELELEPWNIGISSFNILNFYAPLMEKKAPLFAHAHVSADSFTTTVTEKGRMKFYRYKEVKRGGAEELQARLTREIEDSLHFYTHMDRSQPSEVGHLYVTGDTAMPYELAKGLAEAASLTVEVLSPPDVMARTGAAGTDAEPLSAMSAALGAGISL